MKPAIVMAMDESKLPSSMKNETSAGPEEKPSHRIRFPHKTPRPDGVMRPSRIK